MCTVIATWYMSEGHLEVIALGAENWWRLLEKVTPIVSEDLLFIYLRPVVVDCRTLRTGFRPQREVGGNCSATGRAERGYNSEAVNCGGYW
jgi:hypothetical protein